MEGEWEKASLYAGVKQCGTDVPYALHSPRRLGGTVIFVDTERKFQATRFAEMASGRFPAVLPVRSPALNATMSRVMLVSPSNTDELRQCLEVRCLGQRGEGRDQARGVWR